MIVPCAGCDTQEETSPHQRQEGNLKVEAAEGDAVRPPPLEAGAEADGRVQISLLLVC